jgi:hypothetical protein
VARQVYVQREQEEEEEEDEPCPTSKVTKEKYIQHKRLNMKVSLLRVWSSGVVFVVDVLLLLGLKYRNRHFVS